MWEVKTTGTSQSIKLHYDQNRSTKESGTNTQIVFDNQPNNQNNKITNREWKIRKFVHSTNCISPTTSTESKIQHSDWKITCLELAEKISAQIQRLTKSQMRFYGKGFLSLSLSLSLSFFRLIDWHVTFILNLGLAADKLHLMLVGVADLTGTKYLNSTRSKGLYFC